MKFKLNINSDVFSGTNEKIISILIKNPDGSYKTLHSEGIILSEEEQKRLANYLIETAIRLNPMSLLQSRNNRL